MLEVEDEEEEVPEDEELIGGGLLGFPLICFPEDAPASFSCPRDVIDCGTFRSNLGEVWGL